MILADEVAGLVSCDDLATYIARCSSHMLRQSLAKPWHPINWGKVNRYLQMFNRFEPFFDYLEERKLDTLDGLRRKSVRSVDDPFGTPDEIPN